MELPKEGCCNRVISGVGEGLQKNAPTSNLPRGKLNADVLRKDEEKDEGEKKRLSWKRTKSWSSLAEEGP